MTQISSIDSSLSPALTALIKDRKIYSQLLDLFRACRSASLDHPASLGIIQQQLSALPDSFRNRVSYPFDHSFDLPQLMETTRNAVLGASIVISLENPQQEDCLESRVDAYLSENSCKSLESCIDGSARNERLNNETEARMQAVVDHLKLMKTLDSWVKKGTSEEQREDCRSKILAFLSNDNTGLNLDGLGLSSLPDIFTSHPSFASLTDLFLNDNNLHSFPVEILGLEALTGLSILDNRFENIPAEINRLQKLTILMLGGNALTSLPPELGQLSKLELLSLNNNPLKDLCSDIGRLESLETLELMMTNLTALPAEISHLSSLKMLKLESVPLDEFPQAILSLSQSCVVDLGERRFISENMLQEMGEYTEAPGYRGPTFYIEEVDSIPISLRTLYYSVHQVPEEFPRLIQEGGEALRLWLFRLTRIADFSNTDLKKPLVNKILEYLVLAEQNKQFRQVFLKVIEDAAETCGDRMALSILYLGNHYRLATMDFRQTKALADFLIKTVWGVSQLGEIAMQKILQLRELNGRYVDEIEVILAYPIQLKNELELEIDVKTMLYFTSSRVTEWNLKDAVEFIQNQRNNEEARYEFLIEQNSWLEALALHSPEEMKKIKDERELLLENAEDVVQIYKKYQQQLIALSKQVLSRKRPRSESMENPRY